MVKNNKFQTGILIEVTQPIKNKDIMILENTSINGIGKAIFKVRLQTLEEKNNNGRFYDRSIGKEIVETLKPKAKSKALFMEVDHPMESGDENAARKRAITVMMKNCGAVIRDIYIKDNEIIGEAETLSGFLGPDLYKVLVYDKADIGFSLRMFGRTQIEESTGITRVVKPIRPITYDVVTNPSHATAKVLNFVTEDISNLMINDTMNLSMMQENTLFESDLVFEDSNLPVLDYLDKVLCETYRSMGPLKFNF